MRFRKDLDKPLFSFIDIPAAEADLHPEAIHAMVGRSLDGIILRGFYPAEALASVILRLSDEALAPREVGPGMPFMLGQAMVGIDVNVERYLADAARQQARLQQLFAGHRDLEAALIAAFSALSGGLGASPALGEGGRRCPPATVRVLPKGREIGVHVGNDFARQPHAQALVEALDIQTQLSFFMPLSVSEAGGELVVYALEHSDLAGLATTPGSVWLEGTMVHDAVSRLDATTFAPQPGDLLIFDGGRYFHRVTRVEGETPRRTIGGFLGLTKDHRHIHYWS